MVIGMSEKGRRSRVCDRRPCFERVAKDVQVILRQGVKAHLLSAEGCFGHEAALGVDQCDHAL